MKTVLTIESNLSRKKSSGPYSFVDKPIKYLKKYCQFSISSKITGGTGIHLISSYENNITLIRKQHRYHMKIKCQGNISDKGVYKNPQQMSANKLNHALKRLHTKAVWWHIM